MDRFEKICLISTIVFGIMLAVLVGSTEDATRHSIANEKQVSEQKQKHEEDARRGGSDLLSPPSTGWIILFGGG